MAANEKKMAYAARGRCLDCLALHCEEFGVFFLHGIFKEKYFLLRMNQLNEYSTCWQVNNG